MHKPTPGVVYKHTDFIPDLPEDEHPQPLHMAEDEEAKVSNRTTSTIELNTEIKDRQYATKSFQVLSNMEDNEIHTSGEGDN